MQNRDGGFSFADGEFVNADEDVGGAGDDEAGGGWDVDDDLELPADLVSDHTFQRQSFSFHVFVFHASR